jgi:hypothetical protein
VAGATDGFDKILSDGIRKQVMKKGFIAGVDGITVDGTTVVAA